MNWYKKSGINDAVAPKVYIMLNRKHLDRSLLDEMIKSNIGISGSESVNSGIQMAINQIQQESGPLDEIQNGIVQEIRNALSGAGNEQTPDDMSLNNDVGGQPMQSMQPMQ